MLKVTGDTVFPNRQPSIVVVGVRTLSAAAIERAASQISAGVLNAESYQPFHDQCCGQCVLAYVVEFNQSLESLREIVGHPAPAPPVLAVASDANGLALEVLRRGAWDVLHASSEPAAVERCLDSAVREGTRRFNDRRMIAEFHRRTGTLTDAERDVLEAVVNGRLNKQIARDLNVSVRTVEQRRRRLFHKMDVTSAVPLASRVAVVRTLERLSTPHSRIGSLGVLVNPGHHAGPTPPRVAE